MGIYFHFCSLFCFVLPSSRREGKPDGAGDLTQELFSYTLALSERQAPGSEGHVRKAQWTLQQLMLAAE